MTVTRRDGEQAHTKSSTGLVCMTPPVRLLPSALSELFAQVSSTGKLTIADRYGLMAAILEESISEEERRCIDRLLRALQRGRIAVVDELSLLS
ncbi:hypothetical protein OOK60_03740 [Trichothermofontia sichuanensis B231]|uniref:hypothetical protein n=1 Tax=Trichothermofontia sichuanensis TaxID=3045816 RepID=UPI00224780F5|nr:hypothetical protein OOK60_03740 [Trichothermofontia sichuanensis B231]